MSACARGGVDDIVVVSRDMFFMSTGDCAGDINRARGRRPVVLLHCDAGRRGKGLKDRGLI